MEENMNYTEAKEKINALLDEAKAKLDTLGILVSTEVELVENHITDNESEPLLILGAVALTMEGLTEDDTYYISIDARIEGGEVEDGALEEATPKFLERIDAAYDRLSAAEDKTATLLDMGREVDEELERLYQAEVEREARARRRDLKMAITGAAVLLLATVIALVIKALI